MFQLLLIGDEEMAGEIYFSERDPFAPITHQYKVKNVVYEGRSEYQEILVVDFEHFGRALILDGVVQLTEKEEYVYHELLVQVPMHTHPFPRRAVVIGGGDGGSVREILKHPEIEKVFLIELDSKVIEVAREYLKFTFCWDGDRRVEILNVDGWDFLERSGEKFDVIISDLTDPVGPAERLFSKEFFELVKSRLTDEGVFAMQSESIWYHPKIVKRVFLNLKEVFEYADIYTGVIPIYAGYWWTFSIGSKYYNPRTSFRTLSVPTKYYDDEVRRNAFLPETLIKKILEGQIGII